MPADFHRTLCAIESGIRERLHLGAQIFVSRDGEVLLDEAFGEAREGVPMQRESLMLWLSAGKPITAFAIGQLVERSLLRWETRVAEVMPEFAAHGKDAVTIRHLLTHTAGLRHADDIDSTLSSDEQIARICELPLEPNWISGQRAGYHVWATWELLGEIVKRVSGKPVDEFVRENIFLPLGLHDSWLALSSESAKEYGDRIAFVYDTVSGAPQSKLEWNSLDGLMRCRPGGSARGPIRELARFYEILLQGGENILRQDTVRVMTSRQRTGLLDKTFQFKMDWGLGFIINSNRDGFQMPYGYGRYASPGTFGHSGNQSSCAFADPRHRLVVAWSCNGLPGERKHQHRQRAINNAIYEDLGITNVNG
ncbi:MAG TPA: serine hydrolase domain-containing protein [Candidatus Limnocylindria bacterium]|nr:serine hydrolase domain-containing protein [Candidatus Limnocylindria bacterium]